MILIFLLAISSLFSSQEICYEDYPSHYVAYKLQQGEKITFDGKLDDSVWNVPWTANFQDIQGKGHKKPYFNTAAKMRYDDNFLYVGGYLEEPNVWANLTVNNSIIFYDNDFEVFIDPNGDNHYYKELELNARNLNWNLILCRPYLNGGPPVCNKTTPPGACSLSAPQFGVPYWDISPELKTAVYINGAINNPSIGTKYWTIEIGIPLKEYLKYENRDGIKDGDYWRLDFSRVEWHIKTVTNPDGSLAYWKIPGIPEENWVWAPTGVINIHLPEYWGYIQFSDSAVNSSKVKKDIEWPVRSVLMQVYYAETALFAKEGNFSKSLKVLQQYGLPLSILKGVCSKIPTITLDPVHGFIATAHHKHLPHIIGYVRSDRLLWFEKKKSDDQILLESAEF